MKKIIFLCISSLLIASSSSFKVDGMMCGVSCVNKLKAQVDQIEGVKSCNVSFEKGMMTIDYDESKLNDEKILNLFSNNPSYKVTAITSKDEQATSKCSKSCCPQKKEKRGFFKRLFGWI